MSDLPPDFDLKFLPDWLKEAPSTNRFDKWEGEDSRDDRRGPRTGRPQARGGPQGRGGAPGRGGPQEKRFGGKPGGGNDRGPRKPFEKSGQGRPPQGGRNDGRRFESREPRVQPEPLKQVVKVEALPEPAVAQNIAKQIKSSGRACSVFGLARMFLEKPERHRVRITALDPNAILHQIGDGPVAFEKAPLEQSAFRTLKNQFYTEEVVQGEPPKGNFVNVARDRVSGTLLGPTSHHGYQLALRRLYEERYSRRMDFQSFLRQIESVNDPVAVEQWKQQASSQTVFKTIAQEGQEPETFNSVQEAEEHFRKTHLPNLARSGNSLEVSGISADICADRAVHANIQQALDQEHAFPANMVNTLRPYLGEAALHYFKWNKKILYVCAVRPLRHPSKDNFSPGISRILTIVEEQPGINRPELAAAILGDLAPESPEAVEKKAALASDLHYLIHVGHVIEFQNGALDLPPAPKSATDAGPTTAPAKPPVVRVDDPRVDDYQLLPLLVSAGV